MNSDIKKPINKICKKCEKHYIGPRQSRHCDDCQIVVCKYCNVEFKSAVSNHRIYCSHKCSHLGRDIDTYVRGENHAMHGKPGTFKGKNHSEESKLKISESNKGKKPWNHGLVGLPCFLSWKGGKRSKETISKMRESILKLRLKLYPIAPTVFTPNYNPNACKIIDEYGEINGYHFQHALNGGEFIVPGTLYHVDGYDHDRNTVIEYYEKFHQKTALKDEIRKKKIVEILNCDFIILYE